MRLERRIEKLEKHLLKDEIDPKLDEELTVWFRLHPEYHPLTQPENSKGIVLPEHLSQAFQCRIDHTFSKKNLKPSPSGLFEIWEEIYP